MKRQMLAIEGDETVAQLFVAIFTGAGWSVDTPRHARSVAGSLLGSKRYDIILVSHQFPSTNGVEVVRLIRELEHGEDAPVLMVTGTHNIADEALEAGADEVLFKPFVPSSLIDAAMRHLSTSDCPAARGSLGAATGEGRGGLDG